MKALKPYLPLMLRLFGTQIIISLLSNMLYGTLSNYPVLLTIATVLALGIYYYLQYRTVWEAACLESMKDPSKQTNFGHVTGLVIGIGSALPGFVLTLIPSIFPMHVTEAGDLSGGLPYLLYVISTFFFNGQYIAIIRSFFPIEVFEGTNTALAIANAKSNIASVPFYLLSIIPIALVCWFAFWLGLKDKKLSTFLGFDFINQKKPKKKDSKPNLK